MFDGVTPTDNLNPPRRENVHSDRHALRVIKLLVHSARAAVVHKWHRSLGVSSGESGGEVPSLGMFSHCSQHRIFR